jgi:hypothetical protein
VTIAKVSTPYFSEVRMTKAKDIAKKVEVSNFGNSKPTQWDGKKGGSYVM